MEKKVVLISGGTSGIGRSAAKAFLEGGFRVVVFSRNQDSVDSMVKELGDQDFLGITADVTKEADVEMVVEETLSRFGQIDVLLNNAGFGYYVDLENVNFDKFKEMLEVNIVGMTRLTKQVVPSMRERGEGQIINISSTAGKHSFPFASFYSATKFGVVGFSDGLRKEVKNYNIRVTTINPGMVDTNFWTKEELKRREDLGKGNMPPIMSSESVARTILFVANQPEDSDIQDITILPFEKGGKHIY